tara:strand:+ start:3685 stop:3897 length:213 start_codon:yes stop_codon:yes gene_type:complete
MVEVLSEYFSDDMKEKATVRAIQKTDTTGIGQTTMFEVMWQGESVGIYNTEQEAENIAENYALGSAISRT